MFSYIGEAQFSPNTEMIRIVKDKNSEKVSSNWIAVNDTDSVYIYTHNNQIERRHATFLIYIFMVMCHLLPAKCCAAHPHCSVWFTRPQSSDLPVFLVRSKSNLGGPTTRFGPHLLHMIIIIILGFLFQENLDFRS